MNEMIECVARALCIAAGDDPDAMAYPPMPPIVARKPHVMYVPAQEYQQPKPCWVWYSGEAAAAIAAMRVPTSEMCSDGAGSADNLSHHGASTVWQSMIDAALK